MWTSGKQHNTTPIKNVNMQGGKIEQASEWTNQIMQDKSI